MEERLHLMSIIEHSTIDHTLMSIGKMLQILIVCGDDSECSLLVEALEDSLDRKSVV